MRTLIVIALALLVCASAVAAPEVPVERVQQVISDLVGRILACQRDDGAFVLGTPTPRDAAMISQFPQGQTALAILALQYARPHLSGELQGRAIEAARKGLANITQQAPEQRTYSAGLILTVLYQENPEKYRKLIDAYATMLALSQHDKGETTGQWGYRLVAPAGVKGGEAIDISWGDASNTQFALLGLYNAQRAGFQVPRIVWQRAAEHYLKTQTLDGGWGYMPTLRPQPYANMTVASTISLQLCEEMLNATKHAQCKPPPASKAVDGGLAWIALNWNRSNIGTDPYGLYALERLGILMGRANIGGHDWYNEGAQAFLTAKQISITGTVEMAYCFAVAYLARGLEPIIINKLERRDTTDWNNDPYDVKHLVEFLQDRYQLAVQWRIVSLDAPMDLLKRTPILFISGHNALDFNGQEKDRLKAYVEAGGTILAEACCSRKPFDASIRELAKELYGADFQPFLEGSRLYERMRIKGAAPKAEVLYVTHDSLAGRPAILYLPHDVSCRWHTGGSDARESLAVGTGIYFFVANECRQMYLKQHPEPAKTEPAKPEPAKTEPPKAEPEKPDQPEQPDPPDQPDQPDQPEKPAKPDEPDNPLIPRDPFKPGNQPGF